jgi:hypothetical protein
MAEGRRFELRYRFRRRRSGSLAYQLAEPSVSLAPALGVEPRPAASKAAAPPRDAGTKWYGRGDSNPDMHGLNVPDMPVLLRPHGGSGWVRTTVVPEGTAGLQPAAFNRSATLPRDSGARDGNRTHNTQRLGLVDMPVLLRARQSGGPGWSRTSRCLSASALEAGA